MQDTLAKYLYNRSGLDFHQGRLTRNPSQRSNSNSFSANTCSSVCTIPQQQLRYLETDLAYLKGTKRPLVVSFKRLPKDTRPNTNESLLNGPMASVNFKKSNDMRLRIFDPNRRTSITSISSVDQKSLTSKRLSDSPQSSPYKIQIDPTHSSTLQNANLPKKQPKKILKATLKPKYCLFCYANERVLSSTDLSTDSNFYCKQIKPNKTLLNCFQKNSPQFDYKHSDEYFRRDNSHSFRPRIPSSDRSPYESPEMSANCRQLEENLQKILENLVLYNSNRGGCTNVTQRTHYQQQRSVQFSDHYSSGGGGGLGSFGSQRKIRKSKSFPTITQLLHNELLDEHVKRSPHLNTDICIHKAITS